MRKSLKFGFITLSCLLLVGCAKEEIQVNHNKMVEFADKDLSKARDMIPESKSKIDNSGLLPVDIPDDYTWEDEGEVIEESEVEPVDVSKGSDENVLISDGVSTCGSVELDMFKLLSKSEESNFVFSPYSLLDAVSLLYPAMDGKVKEETITVLNLGKDTYDKFREYDSLGLSGLEIANRAYFDKRNINGDLHLDILRMSDVAEINMSKDADKINDYVSKVTHQKIKDIINPESVKESALVLVNALYFKQSFNFDECVMTWQDNNNYMGFADYAYSVTNVKEPNAYIDVLNLKYRPDYKRKDASQFSLYIICDSVKSEEHKVNEFISSLTGEEFNQLLDFSNNISLLDKYDKVKFKVVNFEMDSAINASELLKNLGYKSAFKKDNHDFDRLGKGLRINQVAHKAWIRTDNTGTEAAAATAIDMVTDSVSMITRQTVKHVRADSEFVYVVKDDTRDIILFMGRVGVPSDITDRQAGIDNLDEVVEE